MNDSRKMKLTIELVPKTCWMSNVRSNVSKSDWDKLRKECYKKAHFFCEICGGEGRKWPVECHEIWKYDDTNKIQTLEGLIALCPDCHQVKHVGRATVMGHKTQAIKHLCKINDINQYQAEDYLKTCFEVWAHRSKYRWTLDISYLREKGITLET